MIDGLVVKDVLVPLATVVTGIITGLVAGERKIRADRAAEDKKRRAEALRKDVADALQALQEYLAKRPSLGQVQDLLEQAPRGGSIPGLAALGTDLRNAADRLQILLPDEGDAELVRVDHAAVTTWLRRTSRDVDGDGVREAPSAAPLIELARRLRAATAEAAQVTGSRSGAVRLPRWLRTRRSAQR